MKSLILLACFIALIQTATYYEHPDLLKVSLCQDVKGSIDDAEVLFLNTTKLNHGLEALLTNRTAIVERCNDLVDLQTKLTFLELYDSLKPLGHYNVSYIKVLSYNLVKVIAFDDKIKHYFQFELQTSSGEIYRHLPDEEGDDNIQRLVSIGRNADYIPFRLAYYNETEWKHDANSYIKKQDTINKLMDTAYEYLLLSIKHKKSLLGLKEPFLYPAGDITLIDKDLEQVSFLSDDSIRHDFTFTHENKKEGYVWTHKVHMTSKLPDADLQFMIYSPVEDNYGILKSPKIPSDIIIKGNRMNNPDIFIQEAEKGFIVAEKSIKEAIRNFTYISQVNFSALPSGYVHVQSYMLSAVTILNSYDHLLKDSTLYYNYTVEYLSPQGLTYEAQVTLQYVVKDSAIASGVLGEIKKVSRKPESRYFPFALKFFNDTPLTFDPIPMLKDKKIIANLVDNNVETAIQSEQDFGTLPEGEFITKEDELELVEFFNNFTMFNYKVILSGKKGQEIVMRLKVGKPSDKSTVKETFVYSSIDRPQFYHLKMKDLLNTNKMTKRSLLSAHDYLFGSIEASKSKERLPIEEYVYNSEMNTQEFRDNYYIAELAFNQTMENAKYSQGANGKIGGVSLFVNEVTVLKRKLKSFRIEFRNNVVYRWKVELLDSQGRLYEGTVDAIYPASYYFPKTLFSNLKESSAGLNSTAPWYLPQVSLRERALKKYLGDPWVAMSHKKKIEDTLTGTTKNILVVNNKNISNITINQPKLVDSKYYHNTFKVSYELQANEGNITYPFLYTIERYYNEYPTGINRPKEFYQSAYKLWEKSQKDPISITDIRVTYREP